MGRKWTRCKIDLMTILEFTLVLIGFCAVKCCDATEDVYKESFLDAELKNYVDDLFKEKNVYIVPGIRLEENAHGTPNSTEFRGNARSSKSVEEYFQERLEGYAKTHLLSVNVQETARFLSSSPIAAGNETGGKSSFLAGFGMGFLAFALKKLLLPVFIGAQLIKSVLIAMFLPSILGGLGKIVGKGLSTFSGVSGASTGLNNHNQNQIEEFEFKDTDPYNNDGGLGTEFNEQADATNQLANVDMDGTTAAPSANSRFGFGNHRVSYVQQPNDNYYLRRPASKKTDYKVFHKIPSSSLLLTSYDPFYSPLLSRLDAIFQQLGLADGKAADTERCRERLVCLMYANPAKYAPYSNLVSAQLSRELNELRKPSSDNPDILRFFRYMKAAKDGQDGEECINHGGCPSLNAQQPSPAMLTTYNDINKLVLARKLN